MNTENPFLQKIHIDYRFVRAVQELLSNNIAHTQGEIAKELGVKTAKFSEIMNGRMHVGVDMLAILSENYLVSPEWLLTGRGESMFRKSSILPTRLEDGKESWEHPYMFENEDEILKQRIDEVEEMERKEQEQNAAPTLLTLITEKDRQLIAQAEEIGQLKEQVRQLTIEKERLASNAHSSGTANVG
ncbi:helix-turn-helix domain-containing protein [Hoylesella enoeca]|uniref:helix-turn-helix domain-containing protein n=1 Tax=Hoylesella enoeca TaxID=76123 RepID=UPI00288ACAF0|nr:helix-turn-helix transcriptional regulator [Hoylesella enoeca]